MTLTRQEINALSRQGIAVREEIGGLVAVWHSDGSRGTYAEVHIRAMIRRPLKERLRDWIAGVQA